ncbi:hypothetical protein Ahy_A06g030853 isoform C [Arachis hypogaea]|uniref:TF-B3 domain-containing protein n=1 Tax=Arachis hypogaea TaxID=3818 RepID=A0A445CXR9_ARAHY|nr:hypothetical protein Ahy_A06g030853 isoform C [Arachis hypogaea]
MVAKMRSKKALKELLKLDLKTIEAMAPNPFCLTRIDVVVSLHDPEYCKVNRAAIKANKSLYCEEDLAELKRFSKALKMHHSLGKASMKENKGKRTLNKKNTAASSPSTGSTSTSTSPSTESTLPSTSPSTSTLTFTLPSTVSTLASTSTAKTDIPELPEIFKAIIASLKGFDVTFVMQRKLTKTDLEPNNSRLAMPEKQINEECKFLAHKDAAIMRVLEARDGKGRLIGMKVGLVEPSGEVCHDQVLKKWNMTSASTYNLASSSWCEIARRNHLKKDHLLNIWCFNDAANKFYFLLHHVGSEPFGTCNQIKT